MLITGSVKSKLLPKMKLKIIENKVWVIETNMLFRVLCFKVLWQ